MNILRNLIFQRIPIREKCLNILLNLTQNENNSIRNHAIYIAKNLYAKEELKASIEVKFIFELDRILWRDWLLEICFESFTDIRSRFEW